MAALARELHEYHQAHPHYPPQRPPKPRRKRRQRPAHTHTPSGPGDIRPGTWLWVKPGGLHPAWGDIHRLAMLIHLDSPYCEVWLDDTTVHRVKPHLLILERPAVRNAARRAGVTSLTDRSGALRPEWQWAAWTLADHLAHLDGGEEPTTAPVQEYLFAL
ncbi:hypothetical protein ACFY12_20980 [Streptomyces sp. NPDC001339]|uniref:hypothetical protein n=1 Tax=Streptomyces sp. NPDC001339 TaxID=3364563 RepID=UPI0036B9003B